jgi:hypothetical protein
MVAEVALQVFTGVVRITGNQSMLNGTLLVRAGVADFQEHLAICPDCREALRQYESVVHDAIPAIGAEQSSRIDPGPSCARSTTFSPRASIAL